MHSENLDLNLSLVPSSQREGVFYLNLEPEDKEQSPMEDPNRGSFPDKEYNISQARESHLDQTLPTSFATLQPSKTPLLHHLG